MNRIIGGLGGVILLAIAGCASHPPQIQLTTYDEDGCPDCHHASFSQAAYRASAGGLLEMVLETESPSSVDPTQTIRQVVYLKTMWYPQPGRTYVEATQIDARMLYAILTPPTGIRCDGSAMLTYKWNNAGKVIKAHIESGTLVPKYRMGDAVEPFGPARFTGEVTLYEDAGQVVKTLQFLETQFRTRVPPQASLELQPGIQLADLDWPNWALQFDETP
jgi:hypothetical protein